MRELEERDSRPQPTVSMPVQRDRTMSAAIFAETQPERSLAGTLLRVLAELLD